MTLETCNPNVENKATKLEASGFTPCDPIVIDTGSEKSDSEAKDYSKPSHVIEWF